MVFCIESEIGDCVIDISIVIHIAPGNPVPPTQPLGQSRFACPVDATVHGSSEMI
jgi:hypothetical protein